MFGEETHEIVVDYGRGEPDLWGGGLMVFVVPFEDERIKVVFFFMTCAIESE